MRRPRPLVLFLLAASLGAATATCFSPQQPGCAFACGPGGACPDQYACAADGLCHRADGKGECTLDPVSGGPADGAAD
jgi:hypothetical protein